MELLRLSRAARRLGVHPVTLRLWADSGKIPVTWIGRERRFSSDDIDAMKVPGGEGAERPRLEGLYVRVSGTAGRESSLDAREAELRATATGTVARVFRDRASGLREDRVVRMAQEQAGRILRSACWRDGLTHAAAGTWPPTRPSGPRKNGTRSARRCPAASTCRPP
jgi:excisionase family DNA binding protein